MKPEEIQQEVSKLVELVDNCIVSIYEEEEIPQYLQHKVACVLSFHLQRKLIELEKKLKEGNNGNN